jgi:hypothetical protein
MASVETWRARAIERSRGLLEPGERVRRVYFAQGGLAPPAQGLVLAPVSFLGHFLLGDRLGLFSWAVGGLVAWLIIGATTSRRLVLRTDTALVILAYNRFAGFRPSRLVARLPEDTPIPMLTGLWAPVVLNGEKLWINKRWHASHQVVAVLPGL